MPTTLLPIVTLPGIWPCGFNRLAYELYLLIANDPNQRRDRAKIVCDPMLVKVAQAKAQDMLDRDYYAHVDPDGYGANWLVQQAGYVLPTHYGTVPDANYIESIAKNTPTAERVLARFLASPPHRRHLLGETDHFRAQTCFGVGFSGIYPTSALYWCVLSAPPQ